MEVGCAVLASSDVLGVLARSVLVTRWVSIATKKFPSVRRHATVTTTSQRTFARGLHTATITRHEQRFRIVPRNTMPVLSVMKVRSGRLSVRSCHHQGGCMLSRALTHRVTYVAVLGRGDASEAQGARGTEKTGVSQD